MLETGPQAEFKSLTNNTQFRMNFMTGVSLFILLILYPGLGLLGLGQDPAELLKLLADPTLLYLTLGITVLFQWFIYLMNWSALYLENTGLAGIGLVRIKTVDFAWAIAFLLASNLILSGVAWLLGQIGLPLLGEVGLLIPKDPAGKVLWVVVSITAGFCEEVAFRGYLMTRLRLIFNNRTWLIPTIISAISFGVCHMYQGLPGLIVITIYGVLFSLLYIRTGRLWPCIVAHMLQDVSHLFIPQ